MVQEVIFASRFMNRLTVSMVRGQPHLRRTGQLLLPLHNPPQHVGSDTNGTYLGGSMVNVGWVRHAVCAVTHRMCCVAPQRLVGYAKTLTHPTFRLK